MKIVYGKNLSNAEWEKASIISNECDILFDTARLLVCRDIDTVEQAKAFLSPGKKGFNNPFDLDCMQDAVDRITIAKQNNESVLIFGDYDADGVCAATVLYYCLKKFGINARVFVPEREEGYSINIQTIERLNLEQKIDLLITVDCGISDKEKISSVIQSGIDVIVTDHHEAPEDLPETITINPKIKGQKYPFDALCGAGVAYKLGRALIGEDADEYLDLVALATVADSMDLVKENRDIVVEGLKIFNDKDKQRLAFKYLLPENVRQVTAQTLAYVIAPRVNAGGRMGDANTALEIFITEDENRVFDLAVKLNEYNIARQAECESIYREAKEKIVTEKLSDKQVIFVSDKKWQAGFVGIVASKLVEEFSRPVIVFAGHEDHLKGSARSVDGVNIYDAICSAKDLLIAYGGHAQAAGVAVSEENLALLSARLNNYVKNLSGKPELEKKVFAEWEIDKKFPIRFAKEIDMLEPFGVGNRKPVFATEIESVLSLPLKSGSVHYSFKTEAMEMLDFNGENNVEILGLPIKKKVVFEPNLSVFKNRESLKGYCKYVIPEWENLDKLKPYIFQNRLKGLKNSQSGVARNIKACEVKEYIAEKTLFVLYDWDNLKLYPELLGLPISAFTTEHKTAPIVLVSPSYIPDGYNRVVYLEYTSQLIDSNAENFVVSDVDANLILKCISTDRDAFKQKFSELLSFTGKGFYGSAKFASQYFSEDVYQTIFAIEVFLELGIFKNDNGVFTYDQMVKNALTNSSLYSKISLIKG
ncbi:MAG: single-stranded-DNA-specific exonuclease RecJ [Clostridia bacterium]|nr:single-stranded-DNA-specific exonuclease RecJ [Clostridia bacterium]